MAEERPPQLLQIYRDFLGTPVDVIATYRPELSRATWKLAGARLVVVTMTIGDSGVEGAAAFAAADGTSFIFRAFAAGQDAEACGIQSGPDTRLFAVRPYWGMPAPEWIAADPEFWKPNPRAQASR
jgi:hypothetical protein